TGTIGTNRPDGYEVADQIAAAIPAGSSGAREGSVGLKRLVQSRGVMPTDYDDWRKIEETENARARPGSPREKFVRPHEWMSVLGRYFLPAPQAWGGEPLSGAVWWRGRPSVRGPSVSPPDCHLPIASQQGGSGLRSLPPPSI